MSVSDGERIMETTQAPSSIDELEAELRDIRALLMDTHQTTTAFDTSYANWVITSVINRLDTILGE
jgi:hypothetical protein